MAAIDTLTAGNISQAIIEGYTESIIGDFFYPFMLLTIITGVQLSTRNLTLTSLVMALLGGVGWFGNRTSGMTTGGFSMTGFYFVIMCMGLAIAIFKFMMQSEVN